VFARASCAAAPDSSKKYIVLRYCKEANPQMVRAAHASETHPDRPQKRSVRIGHPNQGREVSAAVYRQLAEFRYRIRRFLHFSQETARSKGIEPQQHQLMLAIKGLPAGARPNLRTLSERLCLRHHSTVELIDRLEKRGAVIRRPSNRDGREVLVELTAHGEELLGQLSALIRQELMITGPALLESVQGLMPRPPRPGKKRHA